MNIFGVEFLAFGNATVATLTLVAVTLLLSGVVQLGIYLLKLGLADDVTGFGKGFKNVVWEKVVKLFPVCYYLKPRSVCWKGLDSSGSGTDISVKMYYSYNSALRAVNEFGVPESRIAVAKDSINIMFLIATMAVDLIILSLQHFFLPTLIVVGFAGFIFVTRLISKMLYKYINKTDNHEGRIKDLEDKVGG